MKVDATPHYRILASIMLIAYVGLIAYVLLNPDPNQSHSMVPPFLLLLLIWTVIFISYYLDHAGVTYEVNDTAVILWRKGKMRKKFPLSELVSVRNEKSKGSIILHRRGFWRNPIYLHPKSDQDLLFEKINQGSEPSARGDGIPPPQP